MGLFSWFKKNKVKQDNLHDSSETYELASEQKDIYKDLSLKQKSAILVTMFSFVKIYIPEGTSVRNKWNNIMKQKELVLDINYTTAQNLIADVSILQKELLSVGKGVATDCMLFDMKSMLEDLVVLMMQYKNGADVNRKAVNTLYGIFIPLGYEKLEVHNPRDFMMF